jgi:hypothetical protein
LGLGDPVPQGIHPGVCRGPHLGEFSEHRRTCSGDLGGLKIGGRAQGILEGLAVFRGVLYCVHSPPTLARTQVIRAYRSVLLPAATRLKLSR